MGVISLASGQSAYRGYEYFKAGKVIHLETADDGVLVGRVSGSGGRCYDVAVDTVHPRKSRCNCPHADGKRIVCKHMVAVYFTAFPDEAQAYITDLENCWEEEELRQQEMEERLIQYVSKMKKSELQQALLQLLFEGPEWQFDRFVEMIDDGWSAHGQQFHDLTTF